MLNKIIFSTIVCFFCCHQAFALENTTNKIKVKPVDAVMAKSLIISQMDNLKNIETIRDIEPDNQSFEININSKIFYIISGVRESKIKSNLYRCAILLFDWTGKIKDTLNSIAPSDDESVWTCDGAKAISFRDYYPDGSLKIIVLYNVTPPSNEYFILPVIIKFDFSKPSLKIDETLTRKLEGADVNTIQGVRSYLKKFPDK